MNKLEEQVIKSEMMFTGRRINLRVDEVVLSTGKTARREIVEHPGAVGIAALTKDNCVIMLRQFRLATRNVLWEIPAGTLEQGEDPLVCAERELLEETGYTAKVWKKLGVFFTAPGFAEEKLHLYFARDLTFVGTDWEDDELMEIEPVALQELKGWAKNGVLQDAKTIIAALMLD